MKPSGPSCNVSSVVSCTRRMDAEKITYQFLALAAALVVSLGFTGSPEARPGGDGTIPARPLCRCTRGAGRVVRTRRGCEGRSGCGRMASKTRSRPLPGSGRGLFPPRSLRYEVFADDVLSDTDSPLPTRKQFRTITGRRHVFWRRSIEVEYEGEPARPTHGTGLRARRMGLQPPTMPDPSEPGPLRRHQRRVQPRRSRSYQPTDIGAKIELTASVHYPTGLPDGPYPIALFLHGNHVTCYKGRESSPLRVAVQDRLHADPELRGLRLHRRTSGEPRLHRRLGQRQRRQRPRQPRLRHGDAAARRTSGEASRPLERMVDDRRRALRRHVRRQGRHDAHRNHGSLAWRRGRRVASHGRRGAGTHPYGIDAVLALAPVDFTRTTINNVTFATMLPTCDGDVSDLQGVHFFDDSRYNVPGDPTPKHTVTVFGANHNFFNKVWSPSSPYPGGSDDGEFSQCDGPVSRERPQRKIGKAYIVSLLPQVRAERHDGRSDLDGGGAARDIEPNSVARQLSRPRHYRRTGGPVALHRPDDLGREPSRRRPSTHMVSLATAGAPTRKPLRAISTRYSYLEIHFPGLLRRHPRLVRPRRRPQHRTASREQERERFRCVPVPRHHPAGLSGEQRRSVSGSSGRPRRWERQRGRGHRLRGRERGPATRHLGATSPDAAG